MEVMVVMLISGITITLAYSAWLMVQKQYLKFSQRSNALSEYRQLDQILAADILKSETVEYSGSGIILKGKQELRYEASSDWILRKGINVDSFKVYPIRIKAKLKDREVSNDFAEEIYIQCVLDERELEISFLKQYAADFWMTRSGNK